MGLTRSLKTGTSRPHLFVLSDGCLHMEFVVYTREDRERETEQLRDTEGVVVDTRVNMWRLTVLSQDDVSVFVFFWFVGSVGSDWC